MTNFDFLTTEKTFSDFASSCIEAEKALQISPATTAILSRRALELAIKWVYKSDEELVVPYRDNISSLIHEQSFKGIIDEALFPKLKFVIKLGNTAVHTNIKITRNEAVLSLNNLHQFTSWIDYCYAEKYTASEFVEASLYSHEEKREKPEELQDLYEQLSSKDRSLTDLRQENHALRLQFTEKRLSDSKETEFIATDLTELDTRQIYIDLDLKLAGWEFNHNLFTEHKVTGMPNSSGEGFVDYILRGKKGDIIGVVEAKKTTKDANIGRHQAKLYADCIEQAQGTRPVIFYTNGYETHIWHDNYPARKISGFYDQDKLQLIINRRKTKSPLTNIDIKDDITNRPYQKTGLLAVADSFEKNQRKALLVMATGSGKTRMAISLVDILTRHNWVKNVLFLADRTSLVKQAMKNFSNLLPNITLCNLSEAQSDPENSQMVFSTYPTMLNAIDTSKNQSGGRLFTVGHFDLIIIDESHRSIYKKYRSIFDYFDSLLVGLTATPKDELDKNTYSIFDLENGVPTFAYELHQAVADEWLVDYRTLEIKTRFLEEGIKYDELSAEEQAEFDELFEDEELEIGIIPKDIDSNALNSWLFNADTIDTVLAELMAKGQYVEGGDKLGKTIIFAKNRRHARAIKDCFDLKFPELGGEFAEVIDYSVNYYQSLIDDFSLTIKKPQIAISVDMLDTGIDVPEVVNLVFFKKVRSKTKFWQMIGRGTRLCENLFGIEKDKDYFLVFDWCNNFEYFNANPNGMEAPIVVSLTEKLVNIKVDLIRELQTIQYQEEPFISYREKLVSELLGQTNQLNEEQFRVRQAIRYVHKYQNPDNWQSLSIIQTNEIRDHLAELLAPYSDDELAKRFDLLMLTIELAYLEQSNASRPIQRVITTAQKLEKLGTIPQVAVQKELLAEIQNTEYWKEASLVEIEKVREALRELIQFIERDQQKIYYANFADEIIDIKEGDSQLFVNNLQSYQAKVQYYLKAHQDTAAVHKLKHNLVLSREDVNELEKILWEDLGSKDDYQNEYGEKSITRLVREIVGLDRKAALVLFSEFLTAEQLNLEQVKFVEMIVDYVVKNGTLDKKVLSQDPFRSLGNISVIFSKKGDEARSIIDVIDQINANAEFAS